MDMVYNAKLEAIYLATVISAEEKETRYQGLLFILANSCITDYGDAVSKRSREPFVAWIPSDEDVKTLEGSLPISCQGNTAGLRSCENLLMYLQPVVGY